MPGEKSVNGTRYNDSATHQDKNRKSSKPKEGSRGAPISARKSNSSAQMSWSCGESCVPTLPELTALFGTEERIERGHVVVISDFSTPAHSLADNRHTRGGIKRTRRKQW